MEAAVDNPTAALVGKPLPKDDAAAFTLPARITKIPDKVYATLNGWLDTLVPACIRERDQLKERWDKWDAVLNGDPDARKMRRGLSALKVPLTVWADAAMRARLRQGITEAKKVVSVIPLIGKDQASGVDYNTAAAGLAKLLEAAWRSPRMLNGKAATDELITGTVPKGFGGLKFYKLPDKPKYVNGVLFVEKGHHRWDYISHRDLIYVNGYGQDTQAMPLIGHVVSRTWGDILLYSRTPQPDGAYDPAAVREIESFYTNRNPESPAALREHDVAELYLDYCLDDPERPGYSGIPWALVVDYHIESGKILRIAHNPTPRGRRPIEIGVFDENPDPTRCDGIGVCQKLDGAQDEANEIHNLGIEAGKIAIGHVKIVRVGSNISQNYGDTQANPILPGEVLFTEDPTGDFVVVPLGDPKGVEIAMALEQQTRGYVTSILGLDPAAVGDVSAGKRVPASLGMSTMKEGRVISMHALASFANVLANGFYLQIELFQQDLPINFINTVLEPSVAAAVMAAVFAPLTPDEDIRSKFFITVNAQDAAITTEERKQALLIVNQLLGSYYDKVISYGAMALQMPKPLQDALLGILTKMENGMKALLSTIDEIQNPDDVLPQAAELQRAIAEAGAMLAGAQAQPPGSQGGPGAAGAPASSPARGAMPMMGGGNSMEGGPF